MRVVCVVVVDVQDTSNVLCDQSLSADNVPLIVDKCINFVTNHGSIVRSRLRAFAYHFFVPSQ